jgi:hypothetical protein
MKNLIESINENIIESMLYNIESNIICESLQSSILTDIVKQMKAQSKNNDNWYAKSVTFKDMFGSLNVIWSEVTDDNFEIITVDAPEKERKNMEKKVRKILRDEINAMIFLRGPKSKKFEFIITSYGQVKSLTSGANLTFKGRGGRGEITQKEKMNYLDGMDIYFLDLSKIQTWDIKKQRNETRAGMIELDDWALSQYARNNRERYKEIIAKNKAQKLVQNDNISELVNDAIQRSMEISTKINSDIIKYSDLVFPLTKVLELIYNKQTYDKKDHQINGFDGLLKSYSSYIYAKSHATKGSYVDMYQRDTEKAMELIKEAIKRIDDLLDSIEEKL